MNRKGALPHCLCEACPHPPQQAGLSVICTGSVLHISHHCLHHSGLELALYFFLFVPLDMSPSRPRAWLAYSHLGVWHKEAWWNDLWIPLAQRKAQMKTAPTCTEGGIHSLGEYLRPDINYSLLSRTDIIHLNFFICALSEI